jgi:hypothetical protein
MNILKTNCTKMLIVQTNVKQLTANSPIINTPRNTVKKPRPALNAHEDPPTIATATLDQVETHKREFAMFNTEGDIAKVYVEYEEYEEYEEYNEEFNTDRSTAKGHINSHEEVRAPRLWICGGYSQDEFQAFKHQWSLFRGYHIGKEDMELRYQLLDSINGPLEDAIYDAFGDETYTIPDNRMLEELEKFAVKEIIKHVKYPTKISEKNPVNRILR